MAKANVNSQLSLSFRGMGISYSDSKYWLTEIGQEIILPALGDNYGRAGIQSKTKLLYRALTQRGAYGNIFRIRGKTLTVGIDYEELPQYKNVLEGRGSIVPTRAHVLMFYNDNGKKVFTKRVGPARPRPVMYMDNAMWEAIYRRISSMQEELRMRRSFNA